MTASKPPAGEARLPFDPANATGDARLVFIGHICSPWREARTTPKNPTLARQMEAGATLEIAAPYRPGLKGLAGTSHIIVLVWLHQAARDLIVLRPGHVDAPRGVFALRSPVRPNPIGVSVARVLAIDEAEGRVVIDAIDFIDGTPLIDIKPYRPGIDAVPDAIVG